MIPSRRTIGIVVVFAAFGLASLVLALGKAGKFTLSAAYEANLVENQISPDNISAESLAERETIPDEKNATKLFAQNIAQQIIENNPTGPQKLDGKNTIAIPSQFNEQELMLGSAGAFDWGAIIPTVEESRFKLVPDSEDAKKEYMDAVAELVRDFNGSLPVPSEGDRGVAGVVAIANGVIEAAQKTVAALYALEVPKSLADFHKKKIALLEAQKNVFHRIAIGASDDPLGSVFAINYYRRLQNEFEKLLAEERGLTPSQ